MEPWRVEVAVKTAEREEGGLRPDRVLLTLPDLLPEVRERFPSLDGRWVVDGQ